MNQQAIYRSIWEEGTVETDCEVNPSGEIINIDTVEPQFDAQHLESEEVEIKTSGEVFKVSTNEDGDPIIPELYELNNADETPDDDLSAIYVQRGGCTCLICKDDNLEGGSIQTDSGIAWHEVWCNSCVSEWKYNYNLVSISKLSTNVPFHLGQKVQWTDPDANISSGVYIVKSIKAEDVVSIVNEAGSESEVLVSELKAVNPVVQTRESAFG